MDEAVAAADALEEASLAFIYLRATYKKALLN